MSQPERPKDDKNTDQTSFASILAGVKRMREQYGAEEASSTGPSPVATAQPIANPAATDPPSVPPKASTQGGDANERRINAQSTTHVTVDGIKRTRTMLLSSTGMPKPRNSTSPSPGPTNVRPNTGRNTGPSEILVNKSQTGNPLLKESMMKTTPWRFDTTILSDYYINPNLQILFLSLKYHKLRPEYIWQRLKKINKGSSITETRNDNNLRILLTVVDIDSHQDVLRSLSDFCIKHDLTLVLSWSFEEAGNYVVFAKQQDNLPVLKATESIRGIKASDYNSNVVDAFTSIRSVNKTDVSNLLANCKSVKNVVLKSVRGEEDGLGSIGGLGATKLRNMKQVFSEPFIFNKQYEDI